jgi:transaldolase
MCAIHITIHFSFSINHSILDWHNKKLDRPNGVASPDDDEGVQACRAMYRYIHDNGYKTLCMPASWRPSRGAGYELDEIQGLAGSDRMTIPAPLLTQLAQSTGPLPLILEPDMKKAGVKGTDKMSEEDFRAQMMQDECGTAKLDEGITAFINETLKLEKVMTDKVQEVLAKKQ